MPFSGFSVLLGSVAKMMERPVMSSAIAGKTKLREMSSDYEIGMMDTMRCMCMVPTGPKPFESTEE
jgi:hypothetical protein